MTAMSSLSADLPVPTYSATDDNDLLKRIEASSCVKFPILHSPASSSTNLRRLIHNADWKNHYEAYHIEADIVDAFFLAIEKGHDDVVADFIARGWVSPDTTSQYGETPLVAAVRAGKLPMVSRLVALGASVNNYGRVRNEDKTVALEDRPERTPLMVAADCGHLALVKVLIEDYGAKHDLIAPDGAIALRLAATNRHREIVQYLPHFRGGSWKRWKHVHYKQMERLRRAAKRLTKFLLIIFCDCPKLFLYDAPKELCLAVWRRRHRIKKFVKKIPGKIKRGIIAIPGRIKSAGKALWEGIKKIPYCVKRVLQAIWEALKKMPAAVMTVLRWVGSGLKNIGEAIADVFAKLFSFLYTMIMAIVTFFRRITLRDIWDGFCYLSRAILIDAPKAIGAFVVSFGKMTCDVLTAVFGSLGSCIWQIGVGILWLIKYIPLRIWTMIEALGTSLVKAFEELMVFFNPKRM